MKINGWMVVTSEEEYREYCKENSCHVEGAHQLPNSYPVLVEVQYDGVEDPYVVHYTRKDVQDMLEAIDRASRCVDAEFVPDSEDGGAIG